MPGVALVVTADAPVALAAAGALFPDVEAQVLSREGLRPGRPFAGRLFELFAGAPRGECVALFVPVNVTAAAPAALRPSAASAAPARPDLVAVADHVNLELRGPLTGRWPDGVPRDFPVMTGIYQPSIVRSRGGARVYSSGVVAAGVADARRLSAFEARAVRETGLGIVSDSLVPAAIVAAYFGLKLAACGVPQAPARDRE